MCLIFFLLFFMLRRPPRSTLFYTLVPYTTFFRSGFFNVPRDRIRALLPSLEVFSCKIPPPVPRHGHATKVLFIGTFVPLQGTTLIAQAIYALDRKSTRLNSSH